MTKISTKLVKDGNSTAVRLPKTALEMSGIDGAVVLTVKKGEIVIKNDKNPRNGWAEAVKADKASALDNELDEWESLGIEGFDD